MVGIPRLALLAVVGVLPFAGALLADDAPGDGPNHAVAIAGDPIPEHELQRRAGDHVGADARALATRDAVRTRWLKLAEENLDPGALAQAVTDTEAFDFLFTTFIERRRSVTTCAPRWRHPDVCGDAPSPTWWMGAAEIRREGDDWHATGDLDWSAAARKLEQLDPEIAKHVRFDDAGAHASTREQIVTTARAAYLTHTAPRP